MKFESQNILERSPFSKEVIEKLHQKAEKKIEPYRPDPNDFRDLYGNEKVDADLAEVSRLESKFKESAESLSDYEREKIEAKNKIAYIAEFIIADQLSGNWLGNHAECTPTAKINDYKNGVDMVINFRQEQSPNKYLGLGIDITTASDFSTIYKKLDRILENDVLRDRITKLDYFESEEIKRAINVPRVVVAFQDEHIKSLFSLEDANRKDELANHVAQFILLIQLQRQCTTFFKIAYRKDAEAATQMYGRAQQIISDILQEKMDFFAANAEVIQNDPATMAIWQYCDQKEAEVGVQ